MTSFSLERVDTEMCLWLRGRLVQIVGPHAAGLRYLETVFTSPPKISAVKQIAAPMHRLSFVARVFREDLPSAKHSMALARLIRARRLLEDDRVTLHQVALAMGYSSPSAFNRHARYMLGVLPAAWRLESGGAQAYAESVLSRVVVPYVDTWHWFDPWMESRALSMARLRARRAADSRLIPRAA